jgi:CBS-domain-containing membrane protein
MKNLLVSLFAGIGAAIAIGLLAVAETLHSGAILLMAPFGASAVIIFGLPKSPLAQPKNVIFGHLITALVGVLFVEFVGVSALAIAIAAGMGVTLMLATKTTHPPAGANPILIMLTAQSWSFLIFPVLSGAIVLVLVGKLMNEISRRLNLNP